MNNKALLLELLLSGFFAIACFRARGGDVSKVAVKPRDFLQLTDRLDRLSRTRWQWFSMVLILVFVRMQIGVPLVVELTAALQFVIFLALPVHKQPGKPAETGISRRKFPARLTPRHVGSGKA
jgi:hypothetical protein